MISEIDIKLKVIADFQMSPRIKIDSCDMNRIKALAINLYFLNNSCALEGRAFKTHLILH